VDAAVGDRLGVRLRLGEGLAERVSPRDARCGERVAAGGLRLAVGLGPAVLLGPAAALLARLTAGDSGSVASLLASLLADTPPSPPVVTDTPTSTAATSPAAPAGTR
jgi:hypothetical protein